MPGKRRYLLATLSMLTLSGCGTTRRFVDQPRLTIDGADQRAPQAIAQLFEQGTPYALSLCDAETASKDCKPGSDGIRANGVGGLFLPLILKVSAMTVTQQSASEEGWAIDASVQSKADEISPLCRIAHGQILLRNNDTVTLKLRNFYCNWVLVGNVIVNVDLSIDHIDSRSKAFNGFYKITFHGTGNAAGSGYYKAVVRPSSTQKLAQGLSSRTHDAKE